MCRLYEVVTSAIWIELRLLQLGVTPTCPSFRHFLAINRCERE
jgi:hypothetical protein